MDLKDIIDRRNNCLICGSQMNYYIPDYPKLQFSIFEKGLRIHSGHNRGIMMLFSFDGTYQRNKRHYAIYNSPITITKKCDICSANCEPALDEKIAKSIRFSTLFAIKNRSLSLPGTNYTNINNMKNKECYYTFQLMGGAEGDYGCNLKHETVRYHNEEAFWHVDTSFITDSTIIHHSNFDARLDQIMMLRIPAAMNLNNLKTPQQLIDKCQMYVTMS